MKWNLIRIAMLMALSSCAAIQQTGSGQNTSGTAPSGATPSPLSCPAKTWCDQYSTFVLERSSTLLPASVSPKMAGGLCKVQVDGKRFWPALVKAIAYAESGYDPASGMTERFQDGLTKEPARSVGLMQLSLGDKLNYKTPYCQKLTTETLKDPEVNLGCSIEIAAALVGRYGTVAGSDERGWLGMARYWSTIRPGHPAIARLKINLPECF